MNKYYDKSKLKAGDLIGVSYSNQVVPAIFVKYGSVRNIHFYNLWKNPDTSWGVKSTLDYIKERVEQGKKPYVSYINRMEDAAFVPLSIEALSDELKQLYTDTIQYLTEKGIL